MNKRKKGLLLMSIGGLVVIGALMIKMNASEHVSSRTTAKFDASWTRFEDNELGFELQYPPGFVAVSEGFTQEGGVFPRLQIREETQTHEYATGLVVNEIQHAGVVDEGRLEAFVRERHEMLGEQFAIVDLQGKKGVQVEGHRSGLPTAFTALYVLHKGRVLEIVYDPAHELETMIVRSIRFL